MAITVGLPFYSNNGQGTSVTQLPGDGSHSTATLYNSWDFALETDWRVRAIAKGKVIEIRESVPDGDSYQLTTDSSFGSGGVGNIVTLKHRVNGEVFYSSYFHLQKDSVIVSIGDRVSEGQEIAQVGLTGARTGAHLHLQVGTTKTEIGYSDPYGWPVGSDNHETQTIANASNTTANSNLIQFRGYTAYGYDLPGVVVAPSAKLASPVALALFTNGADDVSLTSSGTYRCQAGNDSVDAVSGTYKLFGDAGNDLFAMGSGNDTLHGNADADSISGGGGADKMFGDDGNDWLFMSAGKDQATGGAGIDYFIFNAGDGQDKVKDFDDNTDTLFVYRALWGGSAKTAAQVVQEFGQDKGSDFLLDFGNGNKILLLGISAGSLLVDDIFVAS